MSLVTTQENTLSRKGRPRKSTAARHPSGALHRPEEAPDRLPKWNRAREHFMDMGADPRLATQRGKLFCMRMLTDLEFEAANRWADLLDIYDSVILGQSRSPRSPAMERVSPGRGGEDAPEAIERFLARFRAARTVVGACGAVAEAALNKLCRDEASSAALPDAKKAMAALIAHFGLR